MKCENIKYNAEPFYNYEPQFNAPQFNVRNFNVP